LQSNFVNSHSEQALEGKDVKDLLLNVGSGGGAPAAGAGASGGAAGGDAGAAEEKEEEKEEGRLQRMPTSLD
jgi:large subunit ribosomal protein LP1